MRDGFSVECSVCFSEKDARLGMRVERRPIDDALEVTYVEPGGAAERVGVKLDDVVIMVDRRTGGGGYDALLKMLTRGTRPMELQLLRPQHVLNSPLHFKLEVQALQCDPPVYFRLPRCLVPFASLVQPFLIALASASCANKQSPVKLLAQDELSKAVRILNSLTKAPEMCEDAGKDVMNHLLTNAVGFLFMTTVKIGGLVSGMGGTGILGIISNGNFFLLLLISYCLLLMVSFPSHLPYVAPHSYLGGSTFMCSCAPARRVVVSASGGGVVRVELGGSDWRGSFRRDGDFHQALGDERASLRRRH